MSLIPFHINRSPLSRTRAKDPFALIQREMNHLFNVFGEEELSDVGKPFYPRFDVAETEKTYQVSAELPGMEEKDIEVDLHDNILTISGEKKVEKEEKVRNYHRMERSYGSFARSAAFASKVLPDSCSAVFKNGVLTVTVQKMESSPSRKIPIKSH